GAVAFAQPQLSGFPSSDAALRLPALAGNGDGAGGPKAGMGAPEPLAGLPDAARRRAAGVPFDDAVVTDPEITDFRRRCAAGGSLSSPAHRPAAAPPSPAPAVFAG